MHLQRHNILTCSYNQLSVNFFFPGCYETQIPSWRFTLSGHVLYSHCRLMHLWFNAQHIQPEIPDLESPLLNGTWYTCLYRTENLNYSFKA